MADKQDSSSKVERTHGHQRVTPRPSSQDVVHHERPSYSSRAPRNNLQSVMSGKRALIVAAAMLLVVVVAGVFCWQIAQGMLSGNQESDQESSEEFDTQLTDQQQPTSTVENDVVTPPEVTPVPDRSDFAVDPTRTDWNYKASSEKVVYLTFDDGPSVNTQKVLDILDKYNIKATFFVTGLNPDYFNMIKVAYDEGNTIGLHTYSHDYAKVYASTAAYYADLDKIGAVVKDQIGYIPCFVRFPGGSSNTVSASYTKGIMTTLSRDLPTRGYQYYDWNCSSGDGSDHTAADLVSYATSCDYNNIILICHDANGKATTVEALPAIIEYYEALGYTFKPIDRTSMVPHHKIAN